MTRELYERTALELSHAYRTKELSPVEVTRAVLSRIETWEPQLNAMYIIDADGALAQAEASEARWRECRSLSQLDGVPITIKDLIATKGDPVPVGTAAAEFTPASIDQPPAARVREAGCVILGKTTMPDFGMLTSGVSSMHGITRNPWNPQCNTSGSSSGAGAAIAAGYGPLALGTDIGGSVRLPLPRRLLRSEKGAELSWPVDHTRTGGVCKRAEWLAFNRENRFFHKLTGESPSFRTSSQARTSNRHRAIDPE